ncbi:MAG TPA: hypothetical protein VGD98_10590 [Ktedonobacteraceae bacterium]
MSNTTVVYPIVTALVKAEEIIGSQRAWQSANHTQELFLQELFVPYREESGSIAEIESIAAFTADDINRFLRERGFSVKLKPFQQDGHGREFGVASVLDLLVSWLRPGTETTLTGQDKREYPAAHLPKAGCSFSQAEGHQYPIARLSTNSSTAVYLTRLDQPARDFELLNLARHLASSLKPIYDYDGVILPMVDLTQEVDISWLIDLSTSDKAGRSVKIAQAIQETHLALNPKGARAKSGVAMGVRVGAAMMLPKPDLLIDGPFLIWFERPELSVPLFVGYITEADWKNPGEL